jgi:hypothetical protein
VTGEDNAMRLRSIYSAFLAVVLLPAAATAQTKPATPKLPSGAAQARADATAVPAGLGSVFVPHLTRGKTPTVLALAGGTIVAVGQVGKRIVLRPGRYDVVIGSGLKGLGGVREVVEIVAGTTVLLRPSWGALQVEVVDRGDAPVASGYELFDASGQTSLGLGFGADSAQPVLKTWLLRPGTYRLVPPGAGGTTSSAISLTVRRGRNPRFRLSVNRDGSLVGGTRLGRADAARSKWTQRLVVGIDGTVTHSSEVVGIPDQVYLTGSAFVQGRLAFRHGWHALSIELDAEAGLALIDPTGDSLPLLKNRDRARVSASYGLLLGSWFGPYVRAFAETRLFETRAFFSEARTLSVRSLDGSVSLVNVSANDTFRQTKAFAPTTLQGGAGAELRILNMKGLWLSARAGVANRYNIFRSTLARRDIASTPEIEYVELDNFNQAGFEGTLDLDWQLNGWVSLSSSLELFAEYDTFDEPVIEWRNALALRLTRHLSINYTLNLLRQPQIVDATQIQQYASLRVAIDLL